MRFYTTSVGKKVVMAITGFIGLGYVVLHLMGNLQVFAGPDTINNKAALLKSRVADYFRSKEIAMAKRKLEIATGVVHRVPMDLREALTSDSDALEKWNDLTPLARNEWICWTTSVKKPETRANHIERVCSELKDGKRRPCCWPGCPHR